MSELFSRLSNMNIDKSVDKKQIVGDIKKCIEDNDYSLIELNSDKPWGAYFKFDRDDADRFIKEFFPKEDITNLVIDNKKIEISPKILLVSPNERLSWQYHNRRSELWHFLNGGIYSNSLTDDEWQQSTVEAGDIVRFGVAERHRLIGCVAAYTLVAEIWQHTISDNLSDEDDIIRLSDDYNRN